jgi:ABC-type Fe3+-hydroxamate transport system substrate-binding protein
VSEQQPPEPPTSQQGLPQYSIPPHAEPRPRQPRRWPWIAGIVGALLVGVGIGATGGTGTNTNTAAPTASPSTLYVTVTAPAQSPVTVVKTVTKTITVTPAVAATIPGDGTFLVGPDVKPGVYRSAAPDSGNCYWARLRSTDTVTGIIANNNSSGPSVVTIRATDKAFDTAGCNEWQKIG